MSTLPGKSELEASILTAAEMKILASAWNDLTHRCIEDTVYYSPQYGSALIDTVASKDIVKFVIVRKGTCLVGVLPVTLSTISLPGLYPCGRAWSTRYTFSTVPLLDRQFAVETAGVIFEALAGLGAGEWMLPKLNFDGPAAKAMIEAMGLRRIPWGTIGVFERAGLTIGQTYHEHMSTKVGSKYRRELFRNRRRLDELGVVTHEVAWNGDALSRGVLSFLTLEKAGWKGGRGTALASNWVTRDFAQAAFIGQGTGSNTRVDVLLLNGKPIAAGVIALSGATGFTVKGAYDEDYSKFGVGLLLELEVLKSFLDEKWASRLDSATAGDHVIGRLWPERMKMGTLVFSLARRGATSRLRNLLRVLKLTETATASVKAVIRR